MAIIRCFGLRDGETGRVVCCKLFSGIAGMVVFESTGFDSPFLALLLEEEVRQESDRGQL